MKTDNKTTVEAIIKMFEIAGEDYGFRILEPTTQKVMVEELKNLMSRVSDLEKENENLIKEQTEAIEEKNDSIFHLYSRVIELSDELTVARETYTKQSIKISDLEKVNAELVEALEKAQRMIQRAATESVREEIQRFLSGGYTEDVQNACFKDSLGIDAAIQKAKAQ